MSSGARTETIRIVIADDHAVVRRGLRQVLDGEPSFDGEFEVGSRRGEDSSEQGLLATGMRAVNAIPWVCTAAPGIVDALHLPLTTPLGALHPHRDGVPAF